MPVFALKQLINVVQLWAAFRDIVALDARERDEAEKSKATKAGPVVQPLTSPRRAAKVSKKSPASAGTKKNVSKARKTK